MACLHVNSTTSTKNIQEHDIHFASAKAQLLNHCRRSTWFRHVAKLQWSFGVSLPPKVLLIGQVGNDQNLNIIERKMEDRLVLDLEDSENSIFNMCVCVINVCIFRPLVDWNECFFALSARHLQSARRPGTKSTSSSESIDFFGPMRPEIIRNHPKSSYSLLA